MSLDVLVICWSVLLSLDVLIIHRSILTSLHVLIIPLWASSTKLCRYYEKLSSVQARGSQASHQVLREVLKEVQSSMVPRYGFEDFKGLESI